ncbi:dihydrolipoamide acetyltransferase, partial [Amycolatopsis rhizosphaerae]
MTDVLMPRLSDTMEEGVLSAWRKHEGDPVHRGDVLAEIETDKAAMELEAYDEGVLIRLLVGEGTTVPIGTPIAVIDPAGGTPPATAEATAETTVEPTAETTVDVPPAAPPPESPPPPAQAAGAGGEALRASPLARRIAREHGLD